MLLGSGAISLMRSLWQDVSHGFRLLARSPGLTVITVLTLALGIGANTAIFSGVNALTVRPLPVADPHRLVALTTQQAGSQLLVGLSYPDFLDYRKQTEALSDMLAYDVYLVGLNADHRTDRLIVSYVTGNYFTRMKGDLPALIPYLSWDTRTGNRGSGRTLLSLVKKSW